jgi:hypothetical protein
MSQFQQLERPRFFAGKLLTEADLAQDQDYFLGRLRRHNRFLHGWGIVSGLGVTVDDETTVVVAPGLALDCAGNELVLPAPERLSLAGLSGRHCVTVGYMELLVGQQPSQQGGQAQFSSVREAVRVELGCANPGAGHGGMGPGSAGCGQAHALCLATLSQRGAHWRVVAAKRSVLRRK